MLKITSSILVASSERQDLERIREQNYDPSRRWTRKIREDPDDNDADEKEDEEEA